MVAMNVWPTDAADGSVATEARWRKMGRLWAPSGVVDNAGGEMVPTLAFPNLTIKNGACWVDGHYCELLGDQVLGVTANGLAVVRFDPAANTADLVYRDGVSVPAQNPTGTWEQPIAQIVGSALVDKRGPLINPAVVNRDAGASYYQAGQAYTGGQTAVLTWATRTYDSVVPPLTTPGGSTFTIPAGFGGTWSIRADTFTQPGAPTVLCNFTMSMNPAPAVGTGAVILAGQRGCTLEWVGKVIDNTQFSFTLYNGHATALTLQAVMEARWIGL